MKALKSDKLKENIKHSILLSNEQYIDLLTTIEDYKHQIKVLSIENNALLKALKHKEEK